MRKLFITSVALMMACGPASIGVAESPAPPPNSVSKQLARTGETVSGQPLRLPQGKAEMVATAVDIPPGGSTTIHQHPWSRFVYVERGPLRVTNQETGQTHDFQSGEVFGEMVAEWHQGFAPGPQGAHLLVIDLVPPGVTNMVMRPAS